MKKLLKWGAIAVVALIAIGALFGEEKPANTQAATASTDTVAATQPAPEPAMQVSAKELGKAYEENEAAADSRFKGKVLEVSGTIKSITKDAVDDVIVELGTGNEVFGVQAKLTKEEELKAVDLKKGQSAKVRCTGGGEVTSIPMLDECVIL